MRTVPHFALINGSENNSGSTAMILDFAAKKLNELAVSTEVIHLADYQFSPCGPCGDCNWRSTPCEVQDDMPRMVEKIKQTTGLIYAAPVHAFGLSSTMQCFIERLGVGFLRFERPLADRIGGVISVWRRYSHSDVNAQLLQNMLLNRMVIPGSGYPATVRTEQGDPFNDIEGIASVEALCIRLADFSRRMNLSEESTYALATNERIF